MYDMSKIKRLDNIDDVNAHLGDGWVLLGADNNTYLIGLPNHQDIPSPDVGNRALRMARETAGFSQKALAEKVRVSTTGYQRIETGEARPSLSLAILIARTVNVPVEVLFDPIVPDVKEYMMR